MVLNLPVCRLFYRNFNLIERFLKLSSIYKTAGQEISSVLSSCFIKGGLSWLRYIHQKTPYPGS